MNVYLDSSALTKLYFPEENSQTLAAHVLALGAPIPYSFLHELELKNGLRLKRFRKEATQEQIDASLRSLLQDQKVGVLKRPDTSWPDVFRRAEQLSAKFSAQTGSRSLDLLHVSLALLMGSAEFITYDDRQRNLASQAGLRIGTLV